MDMDDAEIETEEGRPYEKAVENVFGRKLALGLIALNWKFKETSLKIIFKQSEKYLAKESDSTLSLASLVKACVAALDLTCKEKVIKVLTVALMLFNLLITSPKLEQNAEAMEAFKKAFVDRNVAMKMI